MFVSKKELLLRPLEKPISNNMDTRLRFKVIATLISLSLIGLLLSQGYWIKEIYSSTQIRINEQVQEALRIADYKEILIRMDSLTGEGYHGEFQREISFSQGDDKEKEKQDSTSLSKSLNDYLALLDELEGMLQGAMHHKIDSLLPADYAKFDSLLTSELHQRGIAAPYHLKAIEMTQADSVVYNKVDSLLAKQPEKELAQYQYPILAGRSYYQLSLAFPYQFIFHQMAGILISSLLLVLMILVAFVYLLYTILRQKTVEELKTDFTNNMTHELKTPISVAFAANDVLLNYSDPVSEKEQKYLNIVREQLTHLSGLVEQILTLSVENRSTFRLHPEPVQIAELLSVLIEQYTLKVGKPLSIRTEIPTGTVITADRTHVYNMLSNLIENAIKYSGDKPCNILIKAQRLNNEIELSVSDTGIGISETNQKRIFDKFFRVPSGNLHDVKGYGLGLYYVNDMMSKHGGAVTVKSQPGKGTTFTLHFKD